MTHGLSIGHSRIPVDLLHKARQFRKFPEGMGRLVATTDSNMERAKVMLRLAVRGQRGQAVEVTSKGRQFFAIYVMEH